MVEVQFATHFARLALKGFLSSTYVTLEQPQRLDKYKYGLLINKTPRFLSVLASSMPTSDTAATSKMTLYKLNV
jgi:hypothetical protein